MVDKRVVISEKVSAQKSDIKQYTNNGKNQMAAKSKEKEAKQHQEKEKALEQALKRYLSTGGRRETLTAEAAPSTVRPKLIYYDFDLLLVPRSSRGGQTPPTMKFRPSQPSACPAVRHAVSCKLISLTDGAYPPSEDRCNVSALATGSWWFPLAERVS